MNKSILIFIVSALVGLGLGYLGFEIIPANDSQKTTQVAAHEEPKSTNPEKETAVEETTGETVSAEAELLQSKGCLGCHSVSGLNLQGGATGPDLTFAYENVESKHGKPINEFLKEPTSAVMSGVISGNPLADDEIENIVNALKKASESN
ncbi:cytochrome C [Bacillus timonensis]|uniref:Cytochrome C n=1 Tax=Bacillus timonensis TaxID=1033734 RepID=A0A4V3V7Z5_9BACI|nr:cytochrome C [Bacillus timonensis]THE13243.1 cytochrome C [Bacillus timonensis]